MDIVDRPWTPGPWLADGRDVTSVTGSRIATVANKPVTEANAHLIAAAPELYEALELAKATIREWHGLGMLAISARELWELYQDSPEMKAINAALSMARGEEVRS